MAQGEDPVDRGRVVLVVELGRLGHVRAVDLLAQLGIVREAQHLLRVRATVRLRYRVRVRVSRRGAAPP